MGSKSCEHCAGRSGKGFDRSFTMAYQPIYDVARDEVFAHEALLRTPAGGSAFEVLSAVTEENRYSFDQQCRVKAIEVASRCGIQTNLSINFMPNAVYEPDACIQRTLWAADRCEIPIDRIIFEFTEAEEVANTAHLSRIVERYRARGFRTALDDFGAGHAGLGLLADIQPDLIKLDMKLIRRIDTNPVRQHILHAVQDLCGKLGITLIAEGVETVAEYRYLVENGIDLIQGYLLARPQLERLVEAQEIQEVLRPIQLAS